MNYKVLGDSVVSWGKWRFTVTPPGGTPEIMDGRYTDLKAKRDGKWVFVLDHASAPLPPPPPSKGP
jgi:ketosteroid isomerase-like protein